MDWSQEVRGQNFHKEALLDLGFEELGDRVVKEELLEEFWVKIRYEAGVDSFDIEVQDADTGEKYFPFYQKNQYNPVKEHCMNKANVYRKIGYAHASYATSYLSYFESRYQIPAVSPFKKVQGYLALRTQSSNKWYALFTRIEAQKLGLMGKRQVEIVNIKIDPQDLSKWIDFIHYFPAYHMNKKHWMTILLDESSDVEKNKALIERSYQLVEPTKEKGSVS